LPITHAVNNVISKTLPWDLVGMFLLSLDGVWIGSVISCGSTNFGGFDVFSVGGFVEDFSGADPVELHHLASCQVGRVQTGRNCSFSARADTSKVQYEHPVSRVLVPG